MEGLECQARSLRVVLRRESCDEARHWPRVCSWVLGGCLLCEPPVSAFRFQAHLGTFVSQTRAKPSLEPFLFH